MMIHCDRHVRELWPHINPGRKQCWLNKAAFQPYATRRSRRAYQAARSSSLSQPESAASVVWNLPTTHAPDLHVIFKPTLKVERLIPLGLGDVHSDVLTKESFVQFMIMNLLSRPAIRYEVTALMLSANYLPSQLITMHDLAAAQAVQTQAHISSSSIHFMLHRPHPSADVPSTCENQLQMGDIAAAFAGAVERPMERLTTESRQWQAADMAERGLQQQLRLWDPATWSSVLQQTLESRTSVDSVLAIRSLMGPPARAAAQKLVEKKKLFWLELQAYQVEKLLANSRSRRRRGQSPGSICGQDLIFISRKELSLEDALQVPPEMYTDHCTSSTSTGARTQVATSMLDGLLGKFL